MLLGGKNRILLEMGFCHHRFFLPAEKKHEGFAVCFLFCHHIFRGTNIKVLEKQVLLTRPIGTVFRIREHEKIAREHCTQE